VTEQDWQVCADPQKLNWYLWASGASERKLRLIAVACCQRTIDLLGDDRSRSALQVAERAADGAASADEIWAARHAAEQASEDAQESHVSEEVYSAHFGVWFTLAEPNFELRDHPDENDLSTAVFASLEALGSTITEEQVQCSLIRDISGNPFRPVSADLAWLTSTVVSLARQMYEARDFSPMPILADALQDAGCDNADILNHCRSNGPHVRGCWVVDLILGKE
jgi:hypothetical protein